MSKGKAVKVNKKDLNRVLVTETTPYETPIIVSNDGFYKNVTNASSFSKLAKVIFQRIVIGEKKKSKYTIPYVFKIKKMKRNFEDLLSLILLLRLK